MFAIGLTAINLSASQRYFDITLTSRITEKHSNGTTTKIRNSVSLEPCSLSHWQGVSESITNSYSNLNFQEWLCPPLNYTVEMQGKYTSNLFKFSEIKIGACTANNSNFPNTSCLNSTDIDSFLNSMGQFTFNFYYINPVINANEKTYISYYLEDRNYFSFDTLTGVSANLFFSQYNIETDTTILPWKEHQQETGVKTENTAISQNYRMTPGESYFKFYLRKGAANFNFERNFQKLDQTLSYIGGLFGTLALLLMFLNLYSKYCYELDFGDRIFKQNNGGSFGSHNFNFIVFLGYLFFVFMTKFGVVLNWDSMKKYHQCRSECEKQLDIDLLLRKVSHFEEVTKVVLEDHHQKMLLMVPKPTIEEARINRKRFLIKSLIYNQLEKRAGEVHVDEQQYQDKIMDFLKQDPIPNLPNEETPEGTKEEDGSTTLKNIQGDIAECYRKVKEDKQDDFFSQKIMDRISVRTVAEGILSILALGKHERLKTLHSKKMKIEDIVSISEKEEESELSAQAFFKPKNNKVANLNEMPAEVDIFDIFGNLKASQSNY